MTDRYEITMYIGDREQAGEIVRRLEAKLAVQGATVIESVKSSEAAHMSKTDWVLTAVLSFVASVSANLATPIIDGALDQVRKEISALVDYEVFPARDSDTSK